MQSFSCTKDLASIHGFDLRLMWESCIDFIHQRRGLKQGYLCPDTVRQLFRLPYTKHWLHARVLISGYGQTVIQDLMHQDVASSYSFDVRILSDSCSLSCTKDLTSNQAFDVRILLDCWIVLSDSELFTGDTSKNYHLSGVYFLALIRKINLVTEFCAHWGRGLMGGRRGQAGKLNF